MVISIDFPSLSVPIYNQHSSIQYLEGSNTSEIYTLASESL